MSRYFLYAHLQLPAFFSQDLNSRCIVCRLISKPEMVLFCIATLVTMVACSRTWVDDPGNYKRAFGFAKPPEVEVIHSYYKEHYPGQFQYFFAMKTSPAFQASLLSQRGTTKKNGPLGREGCGEPPDWFVPNPSDQYELWISPSRTSVRMFRDIRTGIFYVCAG